MATLIDLDTPRGMVIKPPFNIVRLCRNIPWTKRSSRNRLEDWGTGSVTLKPINNSPAFTESGHYETIKMRLKDVTYSPDWWQEYPQAFTPDPANPSQRIPSDYSFIQVKAAKYMGDIKQGMGLLQSGISIGDALIKQAMDFQQILMAGVMFSNASYPANQGYCLRWKSFVSAGQDRSGLFDFYFGDYALRINGNGKAEIYQTIDYTNYVLRHTFTWSSETVVEQEYRMLIYPHARNKIEIYHENMNYRGPQPDGIAWDRRETYRHDEATPNGSSIYTVPVDPANNVPGTITNAGPWALAIGQAAGRGIIQISLLTFYNGVATPANLIDEPHDIGFVPTTPVTFAVGADLNGGNVTISMESYDRSVVPPTQLANFDQGATSEFVAIIGLFGQGDVQASDPSIANLSSTTPEVYGYTVHSQGLIKRSADPVTTVTVRKVSMDNGASPENQTMTVTLDASRGQLAAFRSRSNIPVRLYDSITNLTLFEGTATGIRGSLNPGKDPGTVELTCRGMCDALLRSYSLDLDFTQGIDDPNAGWKWQDAIKMCFLEAGAQTDGSASEVIFQDALGKDGSKYNFGLWTEGDSGGSSGGTNKTSPSANGQRWRPNPMVPIHEFTDHLIRQIMGWHWAWDLKAHRWVIYKRPRPADFTNLVPTVAFFTSQSAMAIWAAANPKTPVLTHSDMRYETKRPEHTTLIGGANVPTYGLKSKDELQKLFDDAANNKSNSNDTAFDSRARFVKPIFDNPNGYDHAGKPPAIRGLDYMGTRSQRVLNLMLAGSMDAVMWMMRRFYEDLCFGYEIKEWVADWGDTNTHNLKKWDLVLIDPVVGDPTSGRHFIDRIEPEWSHDRVRRARYRASLLRADISPPR